MAHNKFICLFLFFGCAKLQQETAKISEKITSKRNRFVNRTHWPVNVVHGDRADENVLFSVSGRFSESGFEPKYFSLQPDLREKLLDVERSATHHCAPPNCIPFLTAPNIPIEVAFWIGAIGLFEQQDIIGIEGVEQQGWGTIKHQNKSFRTTFSNHNIC